jgi:MFS family permease
MPVGGTLVGLPVSLVVLVLGTLVSVVGDSVAAFAMVLDARALGPPWWVTVVFFAELLPPLLLAPALGVLVDRFDVRAVWVGAVLAQAVCFAAAASVPDFSVRVALVAVANVFAVASSTAAFRLTPELAGPVSTRRANSLVAGAVSFALLLGPGLAGVGYESLGSTFLLAANAASFVVVALLVRAVVRASPRGDLDLGARFWEQAGAGLRVLRASPVVWVVVGLAAAIVLTTSIEGVAGVEYLPDVTGSEALYGLLVSAWALGSLPGSLVAGHRRFEGREVDLVVWGGATIGLALLVEGLVPDTWVIAAVFVVGGFGNGLHNVGIRSTIHRFVPAPAHGRAWSYYSVLVNGCIVAGYLLGTPWGVLPAQTLIVLSGALTILVSAYAIWRVRRLTVS